MITKKKELHNIAIEDLKPYAKNPRKNDGAVEALAESLKQYGLVKNSIVVDENMEILAGHTTLKAIQKLGWTKVPEVTQVTGLSEEEKKGYRIADNKLQELATWDASLLLEEINALTDQGFKLELTGFTTEELKEMEKEILDNIEHEETPEDLPEDPETIQTDIKEGDMFILGNHRLICGDSTDPAVVSRLMGTEKAPIVFTDPPYNMNFSGTIKGQFEEMKNDNIEDIDYVEFIKRSLLAMQQFTTKEVSAYICIDFRNYHLWVNGIEAHTKWELLNCVVWDKVFAGLGYKYRYRHEFVIFAGIRNKVVWYGDTTQEDVYKLVPKNTAAGVILDKKGFAIPLHDGSFMRLKIEDKKPARVPELAQEEMILRTHNKMDTNVYEGFSMNYFNQRKDEDSEGIEHPTMKPLRLIQMALKNSSAPGDICLDQFGGSGSTLIQCERMGRYCRMIELDPRYCQVIINRWEKITGQKAEKIQE